MTIVEKSVPLNLIGMHDGDAVIGFRIVAGCIILQVAEAVQRTGQQTAQPTKKLGDWGRKWAGAVTLNHGETVESIRDAAMMERFGS
jgi:hypothetical protein